MSKKYKLDKTARRKIMDGIKNSECPHEIRVIGYEDDDISIISATENICEEITMPWIYWIDVVEDLTRSIKDCTESIEGKGYKLKSDK